MRMINKLKSSRGATMILALALFLICVMVSSIILVVAASSSGRVGQQVEEQQAYLAVSSAADVIAAELNNCNTYVIKGVAEDLSSSDLSGLFATTINKAAFQVFNLNTEYTDKIYVELSVPDERIKKVECDFCMQTDYNIEIIMKTVDSDYSIVVRSKASVVNLDEKTTDATGNEVTITIKTITWNSPTVTKGVGN